MENTHKVDASSLDSKGAMVAIVVIFVGLDAQFINWTATNALTRLQKGKNIILVKSATQRKDTIRSS